MDFLKKLQEKPLRLFLVSLIALLVLGGFFWVHKRSKYVWTNDAYIEGFQVSLSPDIEARITRLYVDEGDFVKKGDLICDLDTSILEAEKKEAETTLSFLQKKIELREIHLQKLRDDYTVAKQEYEKEILSFLDFDHTKKNYQMAEKEWEMAQKQKENAQASLEVIKTKLEHTQVFAPRDGIIAKRWILAGDVARFGQPLFELNDLKNLWITAKLEETKLSSIKVGSPVKIRIDAYPDLELHGHVFVIKASSSSQFALIPPENASGNFTKVVQRIPIKISIDYPKRSPQISLFPGMSCEVKIFKR